MPSAPSRSARVKVRSNLAERPNAGTVVVASPGSPDLARLPVLVRQHHLEERVAGEGTVRGERVDEVLEGDVGVGVGGEVGVPDPAQEVVEGRVAGQVGAQDEVVDEEPDEVVQRRVVTSGDRCADDDVPAGPGAGEEGGERRVGDHEQRGRLGTGEGAHRGVHGGRHGEPGEAAPVARDRRARPVGGQGQFGGEVAQGVPPVVELGGDDTVRVGCVVVPAEGGALPQGEVGVLHGQRRPGRGFAAGAGGVGGGEVGEERAGGPLVGGDVVDDEHDDVLVRGEPQQPRAQRYVTLDVEGVRAISSTYRRSSSASPPASVTVSGSGRSATSTMCWRGCPSVAGNTVRRVSWRVITSRTAARRAGTSRGPVSRAAKGMV